MRKFLQGCWIEEVSVIGRLLSARNLLVLALVLVLPLMTLSRAFVTQVPRAQIQFHEQERIGIEYIRPVTALLLQITRTRMGSGGDTEAAIAAVDAADAQYGTALKTSQRWGTWKSLLDSVRSRGARDGDIPTFNQQNRLTRGLTDLMTHVANTSNLILDPDLDSYYLMDVVAVQHPMMLDQVGQAVQLVANSDAETDNHDLLVVARSNIGRIAQTIASDLRTASENTQDPRLTSGAAQPGPAFADAVSQILTTLAGVPSAEQVTADASALLATASTLDTVSGERLDHLITDRIDTLESGVTTTTQVLLLLSAVLVLLTLGRVRALRTVQRQTEELRHQALHDAQTGVANRAAFDVALPRLLEEHAAGGSRPALLLLDIDEFKTVNDRYGHHIGDHLLLLTAQRLSALGRPQDVVARLGGDEFAVIVDDSDEPGALDLAGQITAALCKPADLGGIHLTPSISMGVYVPDRSADAEQCLIRADAAMYFAKSTGGGYQLFDPQAHRSFIERYQLELDLRAAPRLGQLELHYQPIVDLATLQIVGVEALLRWNHPSRGFLHPDAFIAVAEESGAIVEVGHWVLSQACADGQRLVAGIPDEHGFTIAVNLSRRQLTTHTLGDDVSQALLAHGLRPERLTLEVTETALMHDEDVMMGLLHKLKALGVELAMDDFGTGYSSLAQLRTMPVDVLKIDKAFIGSISGGEQDWVVAAAIIRLAHSLGKRTLAEGIEHSSQLRQLRRLGCQLGQGYLFGRPMPLGELVDLLASAPEQTRLPLPSP